MIRQYSDPAARPWLELCEARLQVVQTLEVFDYHAFHTQVVTPDFFHNGGIMHAFHPNARWRGNLGLHVLYAAGAGVGLTGSLLFDVPGKRYRLAFH